MMNKSILYFLILLFVTTTAFGQQPSLLVYTAKGVANATDNGKTKVLAKGVVLSTTATVTIHNGDDVVFICKNYNTVRIKKSGTYKVVDLLNKCTPPDESVTKAYLQYVWEEFTHKHDKVTDHHKKFMKNTGAVSRGCQGADINPGTDTLNYYSGSWKLVWTTADGVNITAFELYDALNDGRKIAAVSTANKSQIDLKKILAEVKEPGDYYLATVVDVKVGCERQYIRVYDKAEFDEVLTDLKKQVIASDKASEYFMLGFLLEYHNFYAEALSYYKKAVDAAPTNSTYKTRYTLFKKQFYQ